MKPGTRVKHKILGEATVEETDTNFHPKYPGMDLLFIKPDIRKENYAEVLLVDKSDVEEL